MKCIFTIHPPSNETLNNYAKFKKYMVHKLTQKYPFLPKQQLQARAKIVWDERKRKDEEQQRNRSNNDDSVVQAKVKKKKKTKFFQSEESFASTSSNEDVEDSNHSAESNSDNASLESADLTSSVNADAIFTNNADDTSFESADMTSSLSADVTFTNNADDASSTKSDFMEQNIVNGINDKENSNAKQRPATKKSSLRNVEKNILISDRNLQESGFLTDMFQDCDGKNEVKAFSSGNTSQNNLLGLFS